MLPRPATRRYQALSLLQRLCKPALLDQELSASSRKHCPRGLLRGPGHGDRFEFLGFGILGWHRFRCQTMSATPRPRGRARQVELVVRFAIGATHPTYCNLRPRVGQVPSPSILRTRAARRTADGSTPKRSRALVWGNRPSETHFICKRGTVFPSAKHPMPCKTIARKWISDRGGLTGASTANG